MNLFILSDNPTEIAEFMTDKHIVKIILEAVQMLCSAYIIVSPDTDHSGLYKITHKNHPVSKWVRESLQNFLWTLDLCDAMHKEWRYRYNHPETKYHKSYLVSMYIRKNCPDVHQFNSIGLTPFALAIPIQYKVKCPIESYRLYYQSPEKQKHASWKNRNIPHWFNIIN